MRGILVAGLAGLLGAMPAMAQSGAVLEPGVPRIDPVTAMAGVPLLKPLRMRFDVAQLPMLPASPTLPSDIRPRFESSMIDFFPANGDGFHLSAGLRMFARHNYAREAERLTNGLLFVSRGTSGLGGRRFTPLATAGYSHAFAHGMVLGIEGGAMAGELYGAPGSLRGGAGPVLDTGERRRGSALNPVAHLSFGWRF
jgi:hypothetical protein